MHCRTHNTQKTVPQPNKFGNGWDTKRERQIPLMTNNTTPTTEQAWRETQKHLDKLIDYLMSQRGNTIDARAHQWGDHIINSTSEEDAKRVWAHIGITKIFLAGIEKHLLEHVPGLWAQRMLHTAASAMKEGPQE